MNNSILQCFRKIKDDDVHLIGIASMLISTQIEDVHQISLQVFVQDIGHNKYTHEDIKEMENEILMDTKFRLDFPTSITFSDRMIMMMRQCFTGSPQYNEIISQIHDLLILYLKLSLYSHDLNCSPNSIITFASLKYAIVTIFQKKAPEISLAFPELKELIVRNNPQNSILNPNPLSPFIPLKIQKSQSVEKIVNELKINIDLFASFYERFVEYINNFQLNYIGFENAFNYKLDKE